MSHCCCCCCHSSSSNTEPTQTTQLTPFPEQEESPQVEVKLETWENDNRNGNYRVFHRDPGPGRVYVGNYPDLDDREIEWNDHIRSAILWGPPGTIVWLYDSKNFDTGDDILEMKVPSGRTSVLSNHLNSSALGLRWVHHENGIAGKVSGIRWVDGTIESDITTLLGISVMKLPKGRRVLEAKKKK